MAWLFLIVVCGIAALVSFDLHLHRLADKGYLLVLPKKIRRHVLKSYVKNIWEWCLMRILPLWWWFEILWIRIKKNPAILILFIAWICIGLSGWYFGRDISKLYEILAQQIVEGGQTADEYRGIAIRYFGIVAGVGAIIGYIIATARNIIANNQNKSADEQNRINERGRITESMVQAIAQIGAFNGEKPNIEVRLGGLYSLQRIMQDSPRDELTIAKIFYAYVRENTKRDRTGQPYETSSWKDTERKIYDMPEDIQAAFSIISRFNKRKKYKSSYSDNQLDFSRVDFNQYRLIDIDFSHMVLKYANLSGASFTNVDLSGANLTAANLSYTSLFGANLSNANLYYTNLSEAHLATANLTNADVSDSNLRGAGLSHVNFSGANLKGAILKGALVFSADFSKAINLTQEQISEASGNKGTKIPEGMPRPESWGE